MANFSEFNIVIETKSFEGDKIKMSRILDKEIMVHHYKIEDSKCFADKGTGKCLQLQITFNNEKRVVFTSGVYLIEQIKQVPESGFPFTAIIVQQNERFKFT